MRKSFYAEKKNRKGSKGGPSAAEAEGERRGTVA